MRYTKHTQLRMKERGITRQDIETTVRYGVQMVNRNDPNKYTYILNGLDVYVVTNKESDVIITVFKKER